MRIPFLAGRGSGPDDDPERKKLLVPEGRVPRPFPGPWTLRALVRGDEAGGALEEAQKAPEARGAPEARSEEPEVEPGDATPDIPPPEVPAPDAPPPDLDQF
jgi:hypothetical protein